MTVEPGTRALIRLKSARSWNRASKTRCGETVWLKRVLGGNDGGASSGILDTLLISLPGSPASPRTALGALEARTVPARNGYNAALNAVRDSKFAVVGSGAGRHGGSGAGGRGLSGARSCIAAIICTLAMPSTAQ